MHLCNVLILACCLYTSLLVCVQGKSVMMERRQQALLRDAERAPDGLVTLDETSYDALLSLPRDYSATILFTAMNPKFGCVACQMFNDPFKDVARGWKKARKDIKHIYAVLDADASMNVFRRNQFTHVPVTRTYFAAPNGETANPVDYDVTMRGYGADEFAEYMSETLGAPFKPSKPLWTTERVVRILLVAAVTFAGVVTLRFFDFNHAMRTVFMLLALSMVITFTSGYMWNRIRKPPFIKQTNGGSLEFFSTGGYGQQNGVESPLLMSLYALATLCMVLLTNVAPRISSGVLQRVVVCVSMTGLLGAFSLLLDFYRRKNPAYPFRLFF